MKTIVNRGRRSLGIPGDPSIVIRPGQSITVGDGQLETMLRHRVVARWFRAGLLSAQGEDGEAAGIPARPKSEPRPKSERNVKPDEPAPPPEDLPEGVKGEGVELYGAGGWYQVFVEGMEVTSKKVRKDEAEEIAAEYEQE